MSNKKDVGTGRKLLSRILAALCGFVCFIFAFKLVMAVGCALGRFGLHDVLYFDSLQLANAAGFGLVWGFWGLKEPAPLKAMIWQGAACLTEWAALLWASRSSRIKSQSRRHNFFHHSGHLLWYAQWLYHGVYDASCFGVVAEVMAAARTAFVFSSATR